MSQFGFHASGYEQIFFYPKEPYGIETYYEHYDDGSNLLREDTYAQPLTLKEDDLLSNIWKLAANPETRTNVGAELHFTNKKLRIVPPRIPLQLLSETRGVLPENLQIGDVLQTGCVVLDEPQPVEPDPERENQHDTHVLLPSGSRGSWIRIPSDLEVAVHGHMETLDFDSKFGQFVLSRLKDLKPNVTKKLGNTAKWRTVS